MSCRLASRVHWLGLSSIVMNDRASIKAGLCDFGGFCIKIFYLPVEDEVLTLVDSCRSLSAADEFLLLETPNLRNINLFHAYMTFLEYPFVVQTCITSFIIYK